MLNETLTVGWSHCPLFTLLYLLQWGLDISSSIEQIVRRVWRAARGPCLAFDLCYKYLTMEMTWYMFPEYWGIGEDRPVSNPRTRLDEAGEKCLARWMPASQNEPTSKLSAYVCQKQGLFLLHWSCLYNLLSSFDFWIRISVSQKEPWLEAPALVLLGRAWESPQGQRLSNIK